VGAEDRNSKLVIGKSEEKVKRRINAELAERAEDAEKRRARWRGRT
jgi:hypothetical protein